MHHKQQAFQMLSSSLLECKREEALFLSGVLKSCSDFKAEVRLQFLSALPGYFSVNHLQTLTRDREQTMGRPSAAAPLLHMIAAANLCKSCPCDNFLFYAGRANESGGAGAQECYGMLHQHDDKSAAQMQ